MNETNEKPVWEELDYRHDAIIDASAGTGKTYALEHIVEHLVKKEGVDVTKILLVTFTEKAAGELKERIRTILAGTKYAKSLDEATICTIHSFCQELLREYPFESGMQMASDVANSDHALIEKAVRTLVSSKKFKVSFGKDFISRMMKWNERDADDDEQDERKSKDIEGLARQLVKLLEKVVASGRNISEWREMLFERIKTICKVMPGVKEAKKPGEFILVHTRDGETLCRNDQYKNDRIRFFKSLDSLITRAEDKSKDIIERLDSLEKIASGSVEFQLKEWDDKKCGVKLCDNPGFEPYKALVDLARQICDFYKKISWTLRDDIFKGVLEKVYDEYVRLKERSRTMTFDDMVLETSRMVKDAVENRGNEAKQTFLKTIRSRYRIALVDEFQDTDDKQWTIFRDLFSATNNKIEGAKPVQGCLIVVGDPKQAIYSFRGADIGTYLKAKEEIKCAEGQSSSLKKMYRSTKEMVDVFNAIFSAGWFEGMKVDGLPIKYEQVRFPDNLPDSVDVKDFKYPRDERAIELLEALPQGVTGGGKKTCLRLYVENMISEMNRLHEDDFWKSRSPWSSMCVLVRSNADGDTVQKVLREKGIPCRKYKERGIFDSAEAESVLALFDYLSMPRSSGNLAALLLTPFFGVPPSKIESRLSSGDSAFDRLCDRWRQYISKCEWVKFFESAMSDTELGKAHIGDRYFERRRAGIRQIFDQLITQCRRKRELSAFSDALRSWRRDDAELGETGSVRNKESESDAVQIITMHSAKGLEYNTVFVAAGFSGFKRGTTRQEKLEERRLFYVALTRAKFKLYLPWSRRAENTDVWRTRESALKTYLGEGILLLCKNLYDTDAKSMVKGGDILPQNTKNGSGACKSVTGQLDDLAEVKLCPDLPPTRGMKGWRFKWDSFSSLNHHSAKKVEEVEGAKPKDDEKQDPPDKQEEQKKSLVPKGALSGTVFHEVMEKLCEASDGFGFEIGQKSEDEFKELIAETDNKKSPLLELVRRRLAANGVVNQVRKEDGETTASVIARMAWNALRTELVFGVDNKFKLCNIPLKDRKAEVNFVLDESKLGGREEEGAGALNGSIDLLVRRDDGYYIVDWKTNSLDDYEYTTVTAAMKEAGYDLQYQIYTLAAEKWLGKNAVKGIAYLFVRGGEVGDHPSGTFPHTMKEGEREEFANNFRDRIERSDKDEADQEKEEL